MQNVRKPRHSCPTATAVDTLDRTCLAACRLEKRRRSFNTNSDLFTTTLYVRVQIGRALEALEHCLGKKADKRMLPMQPGDVPATYADVDDLTTDVDFRPCTSIEDGIAHFVDWYREHYGV